MISLLLLAPRAGRAQPGVPSEEDEAREHYSKGKTQYDLGAYDQAIEEFKRAYELSKQPLLLFNIAQAYRLKGDCAQALRFYKTYLREETDPEAAAQAEAPMKLCESAAVAPPPHVPPPVSPQPAPAAEPPPGRGKRIAGLVTGGVGVLLLGTGVYFGLAARSDADAVSGGGGEWDTEADIQERGKRESLYAVILTSAGVAAIGGGVALYLWGRSEGKRPSGVAVRPLAGGAAMVWSCAF